MVATPDPERKRCSVCRSPYRAQIEALMATKMPLLAISAETRRMGRAFKRETLGKHFRICLKGERPPVDAMGVAIASREAQTQGEVDFATLVQKRAAEMLQTGQLRVTAAHGLQAQGLLDRRAEKAADRDLALNMARLLSGAIAMVPVDVIDGEYTDVTTPQLAPVGVFDPDA